MKCKCSHSSGKHKSGFFSKLFGWKRYSYFKECKQRNCYCEEYEEQC